MSKHQPEPPPNEPEHWSPRVDLYIALFFYFAAVVLFVYLSYEESTGGSFSGHAVVVLMYKLGGKWLVSGFCAVAATVFLIVGIRRMRNAGK